MKVAIIDASSAILLYKAELFDPIAQAYRLKVAPAVLKEISVVNRRGAWYFRQAFHDGVLYSADPGSGRQAPFNNALGDGERETLMAFRHGQGDFVIIDDGRGATACRDFNIPYINALLCPKLLYWAGSIDLEVCDTVFRRILKIGHYSDPVIDYARTCTANMLSKFLPMDIGHDSTSPNIDSA